MTLKNSMMKQFTELKKREKHEKKKLEHSLIHEYEDGQSRYLKHRKFLSTIPFHTFSFTTNSLPSTCAMLRTVKIKGQNIEMCFISVGRAEGIIQSGLGQVK